jgi:hypothetical protein
MFGIAVANLEATSTTMAKQGLGRPRGSKNKVKATTATSSSTTPGKRCRGCPLGSKNKKPSIAIVCTSTTLDLGANHLILPQGSTGKVFFYFAFVDALCCEW